VDVLAAEVPGICFHAPEATYLAWLDCRELGLSAAAFQFFLNKARLGFSAGETFDPNCSQFVRLNFATSMPILDQILDRIIVAARRGRTTGDAPKALLSASAAGGFVVPDRSGMHPSRSLHRRPD
jgi:bifunctional pyridoxal-dependent enzyme with beta-cystathionase and maltose regulon repressor activities